MSVSTDSSVVKILVVALCATISVIVALVAGILARLAGAGIAAVITRGGASFGGSLALAVATGPWEGL